MPARPVVPEGLVVLTALEPPLPPLDPVVLVPPLPVLLEGLELQPKKQHVTSRPPT